MGMEDVVHPAAIFTSVAILGVQAAACAMIGKGHARLRSNGTLTAFALGWSGLVQIWGEGMPLMFGWSGHDRELWLAWIPLFVGTKAWVLVSTWRLLTIGRATNRFFGKVQKRHVALVLFLHGTLLSVMITSWTPASMAWDFNTLRTIYLLLAYAAPLLLSVFLVSTNGCLVNHNLSQMRDSVGFVTVGVLVGHFALWPDHGPAVVLILCMVHMVVACRLLVTELLVSWKMPPGELVLSRETSLWDVYPTSIAELLCIPPAFDMLVREKASTALANRFHCAGEWLRAKRRGEHFNQRMNLRHTYVQACQQDSDRRENGENDLPAERAYLRELMEVERACMPYLRDPKTQFKMQAAVLKYYRRHFVVKLAPDAGLLCPEASASESTGEMAVELNKMSTDTEVIQYADLDHVVNDAVDTEDDDIVYAELHEFGPEEQ